MKNFWIKQFPQKSPLDMWNTSLTNLLTLFRQFTENFRFKIWPNFDEKKTKAVVKKSSLICLFCTREMQFWTNHPKNLGQKSRLFTNKVRDYLNKKFGKKTFRIDLAWSRQMQLWQGCQTFSPKSENFCSKYKKVWKSFFC